MKVLSLFSGIGAFEKALDNLKIPYELVGYCEIDKYASASYSAIHNVPESMNLGDITKVDEKALPKGIDLITYGFPCQDISLSGKQKGLFNEDGSQTRSGLFFEALRIIEETQPRVAIAENVKNLTSKRFNNQFNIVLDSLELAGYNNYWAVLNAKGFDIPQNRERVFIVSIHKDIDMPFFHFPEGFPLKLRLKDLLEEQVDEKYYLSEVGSAMHGRTLLCEKDGKILVREATKKGYAEAVEGDSINFEQPNSKTRRGRVGKQVAQTLTTSPQQAVVVSDHKFSKNKNIDFDIYREMAAASECELPCAIDEQNVTIRKDGTVGTITTDGSSPKHNNRILEPSLRIRKLTPKECFRLMGFCDDDFEKAEAINSDTQLYKQAGNSIVVPVIEHIIKALLDCGALYKEKEKEKQKEMELRIEPYTTPEQISFNYEELKEMLLQKASHYEAVVYTEDQIKDAKTDRANLNRLKKALNDERIKREKEYMTEFNVFKAQVNELIGIIDKAVLNSDRQVKEFEEQAKTKKFSEIEAYWHELLRADKIPAGVCFNSLYNEKWLNASVKMPAIVKEITERLEQIEKDLAVIENLPAYSFEAKEVYINTLDLAKAVSESHRLRELAEKKAAWEAEQEKRKAEAEAAAIKPTQPACTPDTPCTPWGADHQPKEPERTWVKFQAFMTVEEAKALGQFMRDNGIQYKSI